MNTIALCLAILIILGIAERLRVQGALRAIPIRILVNGTRGKSTVTRMIRGAIAASGKYACAKTTGTEARFIHPDGGEDKVLRRAPASIREQLWALERARRSKVQAIVLECMALRPDLQWICEHAMLRSTIGVVTNARPDHTEIMGADVEAVALALGSTVPVAGTLVTGQGPHVPVLEAVARSRGTRLVVATAIPADMDAAGLPSAPWWRENASIALTVARHLGIPDSLAMKGIVETQPDPGALAWLTLGSSGPGSQTVPARPVRALDASAANDPESLQVILESVLQASANPVSSDTAAGKAIGTTRKQICLLIYNHRSDRQRRLEDFVRWFNEHTRALPSGSLQEASKFTINITATGKALINTAATPGMPVPPRREPQPSIQRLLHRSRALSGTRTGYEGTSEATAQKVPGAGSIPVTECIAPGSRLLITGARPPGHILAGLATATHPGSSPARSSRITRSSTPHPDMNPHSTVTAAPPASFATPMQALPPFVPATEALAAILDAILAFDPGEEPLVVLCGNTKGFILRETATDREFA